jgi:hypothetical protein
MVALVFLMVDKARLCFRMAVVQVMGALVEMVVPLAPMDPTEEWALLGLPGHTDRVCRVYNNLRALTGGFVRLSILEYLKHHPCFPRLGHLCATTFSGNFYFTFRCHACDDRMLFLLLL